MEMQLSLNTSSGRRVFNGAMVSDIQVQLQCLPAAFGAMLEETIYSGSHL